MPDFYPSGPLPGFYSGAMAPPDIGPNGTLTPSWTQQPTSLAQIYGGIYPPAGQSGSAALTSHPVQLIAIDGNGNPVPGPSGASSLRPTTGSLVASSFPTGLHEASGSSSMTKDQGRLDPGAALAFAGGASPSLASAAIDAAAPRSTVPGAAFFGGWGSDAIGRFLAGPHGEVDYSKTAPDTTDVFGRPYSATVQNALDAKGTGATQPVAQPKSLLDMLFSMGGNSGGPAPNVTSNVNRFLSEQGQNTSGMTEGERGNALKKAMGSTDHRGSFGPGP